ncbi:MAG: VOC family protein [Nannocystaceae bacterium]|nr:VOC family protein [Nannocystaceae bacterium]
MTTPSSSLGASSISLAVSDLAKSKAFYAKLGFEVVGEYGGESWAIVRNGATSIGLFQGMFERNMLTFNPGWDSSCTPLEEFTDVRALKKQFEADGLAPQTEVDDGTTGPGSLMLVDPDGNPILIDQHV